MWRDLKCQGRDPLCLCHYLVNGWKSRLSYNGAPIGNDTWGIKNGHVLADLRDHRWSRSCPGYTWVQIYRKPSEIDARYRRTTNTKWHIAPHNKTSRPHFCRIGGFVAGGFVVAVMSYTHMFRSPEHPQLRGRRTCIGPKTSRKYHKYVYKTKQEINYFRLWPIYNSSRIVFFQEFGPTGNIAFRSAEPENHT